MLYRKRAEKGKKSDTTKLIKTYNLVALVENMLELQKKHQEARMEQDKELYEPPDKDS